MGATAEYWSALGRISAADNSEEKTAGCFTAKLFLALDVAHRITSPFHIELGTRPWASHPAAGFTKSQVVVEGLFVCLRPLFGGCFSWDQCQMKQSQVTFPSSGVSAVRLGPDGEPPLGQQQECPQAPHRLFPSELAPWL